MCPWSMPIRKNQEESVHKVTATQLTIMFVAQVAIQSKQWGLQQGTSRICVLMYVLQYMTAATPGALLGVAVSNTSCTYHTTCCFSVKRPGADSQ